MRPPETIRTDRLLLRPPQTADAAEIFASYAQDHEVTLYLVWKPHESIADTHEFLNWCDQAWIDGTVFPWVITLEDTGRVVGMIQAKLEGHQAEIGYVLTRDVWGRGIATEASRALVEWALDQPEIWRTWAYTDIDNAASERVLEKVGMQREGLLHRWCVHPNISEAPRDVWAYAIWRD